MERHRTIGLLHALLALPSFCQDLPPQMQKLVEVKQQARVLLRDVPNYTCLETIERSSRRSGGTQQSERDVMRVQVSVAEGKERFSPAATRLAGSEELTGAGEQGLTATGVFTMFARDLFTSGVAKIFGAEEVDLGSSPTLSYAFNIPVQASNWQLIWKQLAGQVGERGTFAVDRNSLRLLKIDVSADQIPGYLPFSSVHVTIHYLGGTVSGVSTLVPSLAEIWAHEKSGESHYDKFFFSQCRRFNADSTIHFDGVAGVNQRSKTIELNFALPLGLKVPIELTTALNTARVSPGDPVCAEVSQDVTWKGKRLIAKGTPIAGHVRAIVRLPESTRSAAIIEFDQVSTQAGTADFFATFESMLRSRLSDTKTLRALAGEVTAQADSNAHFEMADIPGTVSLVSSGSGSILPAGTKLLWKVQPLLDHAYKRANSSSGGQEDLLDLDPTNFWHSRP